MSQKVAVVEIEHDVPRIDLLTEDTIDPRVEAAWARASTGTFRGSDGLIKTALADTPRKQFNADGTFDVYLIEPAATNELLHSEAFDDSAWNKNAVTVTANNATAPDGNLTADSIAGNSGTAIKRVIQGVSTTAQGMWSFSAWLKAGTVTSALMFVSDSTDSQDMRVTVNLAAGTLSAIGVKGTVSGTKATIEPWLDGWYRVTLTGSFNSALTQINCQIWLEGFASTSTTGNVFAWGVQLEEGSVSTSYIPTTTAPATRAADDVVIDGADFDALGLGATGTIVAEWINAGIAQGATGVFNLNDGTNDNQIRIRNPVAGTGFHTVVITGGVAQAITDQSPPQIAADTPFRTAIAWAANDFAESKDGGTVETDSSVTIPTVTRLEIFKGLAGSNPHTGGIRSLIIYPNRLPNAELQKRSVVGWRNNVTRIGEQSLASDIKPRLIRSPEVSARVGLWIWENETTSGVGDIEAINVDGGLDFLLDEVIRDKPVRVLTGTTNDNLQIVANLKGDFIRANNRQNLDIAFAPLDIALRNTFQDKFYDDTAPNPNLEGKPFPVLLGEAWQVPATLFDGSVPTYHLFDDSLEVDSGSSFQIDSVSSNGNPALGSQWSRQPFGFDMSITPAGKVTATVATGGTSATQLDSVTKQILLGDDLDSETQFNFPAGFFGRSRFVNINTSELDTINVQLGALGPISGIINSVFLGFFADQPTTTGEVLKQIFGPYLAWFIVDPTGQMRFDRLRDPDAIAGDPVLSITPEQIQERTAIEIRDDLMPGLTDTFGARRNWFPIGEDVAAGALTLQQKAEVAAEFRFVVGGNISDLDPFYQWAHNRRVKESLVTFRESAEGMRKALIAVAGKRRRIYTVRAIIPDPPELLPGQKVNVTWPALGLESGKNLVLLGFRRRFTENILELELWG